ncbi:MAG: hypothetical protein ACJ8NS_06680 [Chthoniobacterales bacterium]|jgi:hypothetical protein
MKTICLVLLLALGSTGCSTFSKSARDQRAYRKYVMQNQAARDKRRKAVIEHQRAEMPSLRTMPPPSEPQTTVSTSPDQ